MQLLNQGIGLSLVNLISLNRISVYYHPKHLEVTEDNLRNITLKRPPIREAKDNEPTFSMKIFEHIVLISFREMEKLPSQTRKFIHYLETLEFFLQVPLLEMTKNGSITPIFLVLINELL